MPAKASAMLMTLTLRAPAKWFSDLRPEHEGGHHSFLDSANNEFYGSAEYPRERNMSRVNTGLDL